MKNGKKRSFSRRWWIGICAITGAAAPIVAVNHLAHWADLRFSGTSWESLACWMLSGVMLVFWPAFVPQLLTAILESDAGLGERVVAPPDGVK